MRRLALLAFLIPLLPLVAACPKRGLPPEPDVVVFPPWDAQVGVDREVPPDPLCRVMCENLAKIPCPESAWEPGGRSCTSACTIAGQQGADLRPVCVANAATPDQVRGCCPRGAKGCSPVLCKK